MNVFRLSHPTGHINGSVQLDGSKSISNRVLIVQALCKEDFEIKKLSSCDDTTTLNALLQGSSDIYDTHHAGTTFRFLTAFLAIQKGAQTLTGSDRMKERPIGPLVSALRDLGADIEYLEKEGYPPLKLHGFDKENYTSKISVKADISSQYITALLLIAPVLPKGLEIKLVGELVSEPYLNMTLSTLSEFGIDYHRERGKISVGHQEYIAKEYTVEADWSACSYYYSIASMAKQADISLKGLFKKSIQGDAKIKDIGTLFGVQSEFDNSILRLKKTQPPEPSIYYDFINQPDLAQTVAVMCAGLGVEGELTGLKTLRIKETDRIAAMQNELGKIESTLAYGHEEEGQEYYEIRQKVKFCDVPRFSTYKDHRMAMAFAPLALLHPIEIENPEVVSKSYPRFWKDLKNLGFEIEDVS
jgi:3-phosphoshikimate 1-carboxyvinyltransferase